MNVAYLSEFFYDRREFCIIPHEQYVFWGTDANRMSHSLNSFDLIYTFDPSLRKIKYILAPSLSLLFLYLKV
jgi:hypothetical protein